jgi:hypothetical protein
MKQDVDVNSTGLWAQRPLDRIIGVFRDTGGYTTSGELLFNALIEKTNDINDSNAYNDPPLTAAICAELGIDAVRTLIKAKADVNSASKRRSHLIIGGLTPLMAAASNENTLYLIKELLAAGAKVNAQNEKGETALIGLYKVAKRVQSVCRPDSARYKWGCKKLIAAAQKLFATGAKIDKINAKINSDNINLKIPPAFKEILEQESIKRKQSIAAFKTLTNSIEYYPSSLPKDVVNEIIKRYEKDL